VITDFEYNELCNSTISDGAAVGVADELGHDETK
jgi:hypothetical protein